MELFDTEYSYEGVEKCPEHKDYKVMMYPTSKCKKCLNIWKKRCENELGYKEIAFISANKKAVSIDRDKTYVLYWEESGKCKCISTVVHNFWFTVPELEGLYSHYSMVIGGNK
jgi:hypothetical protein